MIILYYVTCFLVSLAQWHLTNLCFIIYHNNLLWSAHYLKSLFLLINLHINYLFICICWVSLCQYILYIYIYIMNFIIPFFCTASFILFPVSQTSPTCPLMISRISSFAFVCHEFDFLLYFFSYYQIFFSSISSFFPAYLYSPTQMNKPPLFHSSATI